MRFTILANLISAAGAFGLTILFSRNLHNDDFATIAVWSSLFSWGQFFVSLSSAGFVVRAIVTDGREEGIRAISTIVQYVALTSLLCVAAWLALGWFTNGPMARYSELFVFSCVLASLTAVQSAVSGYYRFIELHKVANLIQLTFSLGTVAATAAAAAFGTLSVVDRVRIPAAIMLGILFIYRPGVRSIASKLRLVPLSELVSFIKYSLGFMGHSAAHTIVGGLDRLVLNGHVSALELGNYHVIKQGAESLRIIGQAIQAQMAPVYLKFLRDGREDKSKAQTRHFVLYIAAGAIFSVGATIALFILSGRVFEISICVLCLLLVMANAIYSLYDFRSLSWSLGKGYGLSVRSVAVCSLYAICVYALERYVDAINMSIIYLSFTAVLLASGYIVNLQQPSHESSCR